MTTLTLEKDMKLTAVELRNMKEKRKNKEHL